MLEQAKRIRENGRRHIQFACYETCEELNLHAIDSLSQIVLYNEIVYRRSEEMSHVRYVPRYGPYTESAHPLFGVQMMYW